MSAERTPSLQKFKGRWTTILWDGKCACVFKVGEEVEAVTVSWTSFFKSFLSLRFSTSVIRAEEIWAFVQLVPWDQLLGYISTPSLAPLV